MLQCENDSMLQCENRIKQSDKKHIAKTLFIANIHAFLHSIIEALYIVFVTK